MHIVHAGRVVILFTPKGVVMAAKPSKQVLGGREKVKVAIAQKSPAFMNREASRAGLGSDRGRDRTAEVL